LGDIDVQSLTGRERDRNVFPPYYGDKARSAVGFAEALQAYPVKLRLEGKTFTIDGSSGWVRLKLTDGQSKVMTDLSDLNENK